MVLEETKPEYSGPAATSQRPETHYRKIAIAVDLSDESAFAVKWAVENYLRPGDSVTLLHVQPTSVLYGADWGRSSVDRDDDHQEESSIQKLEDDFDALTSSKVADVAAPLAEAEIPYKVHIVKDHDMKERLCLEVERMKGLSAVIMGSRGFGAVSSKKVDVGEGSGRRLGSVSDYCVHHCACPVVVVRFSDEKEDGVDVAVTTAEEVELRPLPEEEEEEEECAASSEQNEG